MIIYKTTDRIPVKIGKVKFKVSPLTQNQKAEINNCSRLRSGEEVQDGFRMVFLAVKYGIKEASGLKNADDSAYVLEFDEDVLSDDCTNELLQLECSTEIVGVCSRLTGSLSRLKEVEGVKVDFSSVESVKKK